MLFQHELLIPANTTESSPTTETMKVARGVITKIMVRPRAGHWGLAHCIIRHHEHQIAPSTEGMSFHGDFFPIDWEEYYEVYEPPYELKVQGWNDDDTYQHGFDIFVAILPQRALMPNRIVTSLQGFFSLFTSRRIEVGE